MPPEDLTRMTEALAASPANLISMPHWGTDPAVWLRAMLVRYERPLLSFAARIVGDHEAARDIVQDVFVRLDKAGPWQFESADPRKWLFTVCRNRALDRCRREKRLSFVDDETLANQPCAGISPSEAISREEDRGTLLRLVEQLPPRQQELIQLKFQNDLSYREIADITGLSETNVGFLLHTALKFLRERRAAFGR